MNSDLDDYENLHQVRIVGKRLRYAMELFATCFTAPFKDDIYPRIEAMQEILGLANDSYVASGALQQLADGLRVFQPNEWKRCRPGIDYLLRYHRRRFPQQRDKFLAPR